MLSRSYRLRKKEVDRLFRKGFTQRNAFFSLKSLVNRTNHFRLAVVIPKAQVKKATARNRLKRKIIEQILKLKLANLDIAIVLKNKIKEEQLEKELKDILGKISNF